MTTARDLSAHLAALLRREHEAMADFLVALSEFGARRLWSDLGYASLFDFLHRELGLSKSAARYRKVAAELIRRCPEVVEPLRTGSLCFSSIIELAKVVTPQNVAEILPRFFHRSKREAMQVVAELMPMERPPVRDIVTPAAGLPLGGVVASAANPAELPEQSAVVDRCGPVELDHVAVHPAEPVDAKLPVEGRGLLSQMIGAVLVPRTATESARKSPSRAPTRELDRTVSEPLTAELCRLHVTIPTKMLEKIQAARDLLSHARPNASTGDILDAALAELLEKLARTKRLATKRKTRAEPDEVSPKETSLANPRAGSASSQTEKPAEHTDPCDGPSTAPPRYRREYIPADVRRAVWERDGGRCSFPLEGGGVCGSTYQLELDHITPVARGGSSTVEGLRVACKPHNIDAARRIFGEAFVDECIRRRRAGGSGGARVAARAEVGT
jgi:5-methylcytosine-specific restriction endonuclease McrA